LWAHLSRMEDINLVKKITDWNPVGVRTKVWPKIRWRDEVINDLQKLKLRNWSQLIKDRKACNDLVQRTKTHVGFQCQKENNKAKFVESDTKLAPEESSPKTRSSAFHHLKKKKRLQQWTRQISGTCSKSPFVRMYIKCCFISRPLVSYESSVIRL
jgi:hypothetical protein